MIHSHLKALATFVDEDNCQVQFRNNLSYEANRSFRDDDGLDPLWMKSIWWRSFRVKMAAAGVAVRAGQSVLDACCGQGFLGDYLAAQGARVTFADLSLHQLGSLKDRPNTAGTPVGACQADISRLPFRSGSFDFVVGNSFLHHLPDVPAALREMHRVLKKGGRLVLLHEPSVSANWWETFPLSVLKDTTYNSGFTDLWQFRASALLGILERCGFADVRIRGSGILGAVLCNWYLILASKARITNRFVVGPALVLRTLLAKLELARASERAADTFPSLLAAASKR